MLPKKKEEEIKNAFKIIDDYLSSDSNFYADFMKSFTYDNHKYTMNDKTYRIFLEDWKKVQQFLLDWVKEIDKTP